MHSKALHAAGFCRVPAFNPNYHRNTLFILVFIIQNCTSSVAIQNSRHGSGIPIMVFINKVIHNTM